MPIVYHAFPKILTEGEDTRKVLMGEVNMFEPGDIDYDLSRRADSPSFPITLHESCDKVRESFDTTLRLINEKKLEFQQIPLGSNKINNSNAFVYTLLEKWNPFWRRELERGFFAHSPTGFNRKSVPGYGYLLPIN